MIKYIVYKTTNRINKKIYIGVHKIHSTKFDWYFGSGNQISDALVKYGYLNFNRETLYSVDDEELAYFIEENIVTEEFISLRSNYNNCVGGKGGYKAFHTDKAKANRTLTNILKYGNPAGAMHTERGKYLANKNRLITKIKVYNHPMGKCNSKESKDKSFATKLKLYGTKAGKLHNKEVRKLAYNTKEDIYISKNPELNLLLELINPSNEIEYSGTLMEITIYMFDRRSLGLYFKDILKKAKLGTKYNARSKWKGYKLNLIERSTTILGTGVESSDSK
jgi:hypothetical protein